MAQSQDQKVLRIGLIHNGQIIEEKLMRHGQQVNIGRGDQNDLVLRIDGFPETYPLFFYKKNEGYYLHFSTNADGKISRDDDVFEFKEIVEKGLSTAKGKNHIVKIKENDRGKMKIGDHSLVFQFITPPPPAHLRYPTKLKVNMWDMIDWYFASAFIFSFMLQTSTVAYLTSTFDPIAYEKKNVDMSARFVEILKIEKPKEKPKEIEKPKEKPKEQPKDPGPADDSEPTEVATQDLPPPDTAENKAVRKQILTQKVQSSTVLKFLVSSEGGDSSIVGELSGEASKVAISEAFKGAGLAVADGTNTSDKRDKALGSETGKTLGIDDSKIGSASGPRKTVTTGQIQERAPTGKLKVDKPSEAVGSGSLSSAKIQETVNRRSGALKGCYESELKKDDSLQGKIKVQFTIEASGRVNQVKVVENTLNATVGQCVTAQIQRWRFPSPEGGDVTIVYPFVFSSSR